MSEPTFDTLIQSLNLKMDAVEDRLGVSRVQLWRYRNGRAGEWSSATLERLAAGLGLPVQEVLDALVRSRREHEALVQSRIG